MNGFSLFREVQGSLANQAPEDQWVQGDLKGHLERRAEGEQKDRMAQRGPKETPLVCILMLCVCFMIETVESKTDTAQK